MAISIYRFSIRDMLFIMLTVCLVVGWWIDHTKGSLALGAAEMWRKRAGALEELLIDSGGRVVWGDDTVSIRYPKGTWGLQPIEHCEPSPIVQKYPRSVQK